MKIKLSKAYLDNVVFQDFTLEIVDHKINIVIGPSGCGKTTLLECIANISDYDGEIIPKVEKIGYVFQEDRLFPYLTILKNLLIINDDVKKVDYLLTQFNVEYLKHKYPHQISGGEKQRIALIRAFLHDNELILMDEPFKSLDYHLKYNLVEMIYKLYEKTNKTIILVTHDLDITLYLGHYIHVLSLKRPKLKATLENNFVAQALNNESILLLNELKALMV